jgi:hypothetical protein
MRYLRVHLDKEDLYWQRRLDDQKVGILESTPLGSPEPLRTPPENDPQWDNFLRRNLSPWYLQVHYPHLLNKEVEQVRSIWGQDDSEIPM